MSATWPRSRVAPVVVGLMAASSWVTLKTASPGTAERVVVTSTTTTTVALAVPRPPWTHWALMSLIEAEINRPNEPPWRVFSCDWPASTAASPLTFSCDVELTVSPGDSHKVEVSFDWASRRPLTVGQPVFQGTSE